MKSSGIVKTKTVYQMEATECGAASLCMIFDYWGHYIPLEQMRVETGVSRDGCAAGNLMRTALKYGFETHGYRKEPESLKSLQMPCIIHWNFEHFVVLEGFKGNYVYLNDPACGRRKVDYETFDSNFTGIVMTFAPTEKFEKKKSDQKVFNCVKEKLKNYKKSITKLVLIGIVLAIPQYLLPYFSQVFIDKILGKQGVEWFPLFIAAFVITVFVEAFLGLYRSRIMRKIQANMTMTSTRSFLSHMFRLPMGFFEQRYAGDLAVRVDNNDSVNTFMTGDLTETVLNAITSAVFFLILLYYSVPLTFLATIGLAINLVIGRYASERISRISTKTEQDSGKLSGATTAGISISSTIKASGAEQAYIARILGYSAKVNTTEQKINKMNAVAKIFPDIIEKIITVSILVVGGLQVVEGKMTPGMLAAFSSIYLSFSAPVNALIGFVKNLESLRVDTVRVDDIMRYPTDAVYEIDPNKGKIDKKLSGKVSFKDISFGYNPLGKPIISDISFDIPCGNSVAFVGASGSGKSTVSKLVSGLYRPWNGEILLDGTSIKDISPEVFHASVSTVSQNISLFSGTIRDNLTMWNPAILEHDIINAAKDACIHDVITQKPGAYDFKLTENGDNLSGGQKQRLEIARALVTNPTILIMDEATSALDPIVEKQIIDNIKRRGCTCIMVAHRLSAIRDCDMIYVISGGNIIQKGSHEQLMAENGIYRNFMAVN